jgi:hypothetical protein
MTVFDLDRYVVREYERFARSFTNIHAKDLKSKIADAYASNKFWPEPMIQLNPRFKSGGIHGEVQRRIGLLQCGIQEAPDCGACGRQALHELRRGARVSAQGARCSRSNRIHAGAHDGLFEGQPPGALRLHSRVGMANLRGSPEKRLANRL